MMAGSYKTPIVAFRNLGNLKFEDMGSALGLDQPGLPNGIAVGDLDNDGGLDFVLNNLGSGGQCLSTTTARAAGGVRLKGFRPTRRASVVKSNCWAVPCHAKPGGGVRWRLSFRSGPLRVFAAGKSESMISK